MLEFLQSSDSRKRENVRIMTQLLRDMSFFESEDNLPDGWHRGMSEVYETEYYWKVLDDGTYVAQWDKPEPKTDKFMDLQSAKDDFLYSTSANFFEKASDFVEEVRKYEENFATGSNEEKISLLSITKEVLDFIKSTLRGLMMTCARKRVLLKSHAAIIIRSASFMMPKNYNKS